MKTPIKRIFKTLFWSGVFSLIIIMYIFLALSPGLIARPPMYIPEIYVSEDPFIYYSDNHNSAYVGVIEHNGQQLDFFIGNDEMGNACFWKLEHLPHYLSCRDGDISCCENALLFKGLFRYNNGAEHLFQVTFDNIGIFDRDNSKIRFIAYNKEEYLKKHGILKLMG